MNQTVSVIRNQLQDITVGVIRAGHEMCGPTWHGYDIKPPFGSIGFILNGEGTMITDGEETHPAKGQLYLLPAKSLQTFYTQEENPYEKYYCHFDARCGGVDLFELLKLPLYVPAKEPEKVIRIFESMIEHVQGESLNSLLQVKKDMLDLIVCYLESCPAEKIKMSGTEADIAFSRAIDYVENHLNENITVKKMAEEAGYQSGYFTKIFQKRMGISPQQFIARKKTQKAIEMLTSANLSVSVIAEELGFSNQFYFCNFFKKQTGMTPTEYRCRYR